MKRLLLVLAALCIATAAPAYWQSRSQVSVSAGAAYVGPGDVSGWSGAYAWYSCTYAYNAATASTSTSLCDLVDSAAPTTVICTLRATTTGLVDLSAYCPGSLTPAAICAAATGAVCNISQAYDLSGNSRHVLQATATSQPFLTFAGLDSKPEMRCTAATCLLATASSALTQAQPITFTYVGWRDANAGLTGMIGSSGSDVHLGNNGNNNCTITAITNASIACTTAQYNGVSGLASGTGNNCAVNLNGTDTASLNCGTTGLSSVGIRLWRPGARQASGRLSEAGMLAATTTPTQRGDYYTNAKARYTTLP